MADLKLENVCKVYPGGSLEAVTNLNLSCKDGEFLCLLGPSGCGKSSTLRMIAGLEAITSGKILLGGRLVNDVLPKDRNVAMVFENYALYTHVTVFENIAFPLKIRSFSKIEIREKVESVSKYLDIVDILPRKIRGLSDGQKQRISIARALVRDPSILLMDEPISHIDTHLRTKVRNELKRIQRDKGVTCIYVTHDQIEAMALADRIAVMNSGKLQQVGSPDELYSHPVNEFVAGFIGEPPMNILESKIIEENNKLCLVINDSLRIKLSEKKTQILREAKFIPEVLIGVRPSDVIVSKEKFHDSIETKIFLIEPRGDDTVLTTKLGEHFFRIVVNGNFKAEEESIIWMKMEEERIHVFDKNNGLAYV